ncbi:MAG: hypothetical protein QY325_12065 [Flavobacteriales bacterium]|jgi:hypothetical protein|nr:MAG: hypothetical protein QY325_12065 [Flavobacteriales bacterium]
MKQRIDHTNYEAWLLDRQEGRLTPAQEHELLVFLLAHPELDQGSEEWPTLDAAADSLHGEEKEALKRTLPPTGAISRATLEDYLVARLEGDLTPAQEEALEQHLMAHPEDARLARLVAATKLVPGYEAFPGRDSLVRELPPKGAVGRHTLEDHLVARLEGDLDPGQESALSAFLEQDEDAAREWLLLQRTRIAPEAIVYPDKSSLKREARVVSLFSVRPLVRWAAAAAVLAAMVTAWWQVQEPKQKLAAGPSVSTSIPPITPPSARRQQRSAPIAAQPKAGQEDSQALGTAASPHPEPGTAPASRSERPKAVPEPSPEPAPMIAQEEPAPIGLREETRPMGQEALAHEGPIAGPSQAIRLLRPTQPEALPLGQALAATLRERVLEQPSEAGRPLDADDAIAAVDKGLRTLGGDRAGLQVARDAGGRSRSFNLRLGRNLAISARR